MTLSSTDFIRSVFKSDLKTMLTEEYPLATQLSVMLLLHKKASMLGEDTNDVIRNTFTKALSIVVEHSLRLVEEECEVSTAVKKLNEDGEGGGEGSAPPANVVAGIEPTTPRIYTGKKTKDEFTS